MDYNDEEIPNQYHGQPPSYMLPNTDPMNNMSSCYLNSSLERVSQNGVWSDQVGNGPGSSSSGTFVASAYPVQSHTDPGGLHPLNTSSLAIGTTDRILPTPAVSRGLAAPAVSSLESLACSETAPSSAFSHRSSLGWNTDSLSSTSQASSRVSNSLSQGSTERSMMVGTTHDIGFGWTSTVSHSPAGTVQTTTDVVDPQAYSPFDIRAPIETEVTQRCRTESCESLMPASNTTTGSYGYDGSSHGRYSILNSSSSAHLIDGQEYTRVQQNPTRQRSLVTDCQQGCSQCQDHASQRGSVT